MAIGFAIAFAAITVLHVVGMFTHYDLRIVAHLIPARDHPRVLALVHPLVHLGDAAFIGVVVVAGTVGLWLMGYRRTWAMFVIVLSWPIELACKIVLPQPDGLGSTQASVSISSLVHGAGTKTVAGWLRHATPEGVQALAGQAGGFTVNLVSSYPSGTTARGTFVLGLIIWICVRLGIPVLSELSALLLLAPLSVLGLAMVLYAWHWPSDVLGGYALGFALLATTLAVVRRPVGRHSGNRSSFKHRSAHGPLYRRPPESHPPQANQS
jgi:hypothetical protein